MKHWKALVAAMLAASILCGCGGGDVSTAGRQIKESRLFSKSEVADAMDVVEEFFRKEFDGCTLITLVYDEEATAKKAAQWAESYDVEEAIVLLSDFRVDESGGDGSLNPNQTYRNYEWVLVKTFLGWKLKTWGYC